MNSDRQFGTLAVLLEQFAAEGEERAQAHQELCTTLRQELRGPVSILRSWMNDSYRVGLIGGKTVTLNMLEPAALDTQRKFSQQYFALKESKIVYSNAVRQAWSYQTKTTHAEATHQKDTPKVKDKFDKSRQSRNKAFKTYVEGLHTLQTLTENYKKELNLVFAFKNFI